MKFLYPSFLWALFTVLIPVIIHLFNFRRYKTVFFSNVAFLQNIRKESKSRSQLKNLLLLLIRVLAIVFLVMVFAQPYIPQNNKTVATKQNIVAVYIDNSFSMEATGKYGIMLENAKMKVHEIANSYGYDTKFLLTTNNFQFKHQQLVNKDQFIDWVSQVKSTHLIRTIDQVDELQQGVIGNFDSLTNIHQYILSDFQKSTFHLSHEIPKNINQQYLVNFENSNTSNIYIDSVWFETPGQYIGKQENLLVGVWNKSDQEVTDLQINFYLNDSLKSLANISISPNTRQVVVLPFVQTTKGRNLGKVQLNDYPITFDNEFFFSYYLTDKINVLQIADNLSVDYLKVLFSNDKNFSFDDFNQNKVSYDDLRNYHVIVLNGLINISSGMIDGLSQQVKIGTRLVIIPPLEFNKMHYQRLIKKLDGVGVGLWRNERGHMQNLNRDHQFFKEAIKNSEGKISLPEYKGYYSTFISSKSDAIAIVESEAGKPIIIQEKYYNGDYILFTIPLNDQLSGIATHPIFVPLFYNMALYSNKITSLYYNLNPNLSVSLNSYSFSEGVTMVSLQDNSEIMPRMVYGNNNLTVFIDEQDYSAGYYKLQSNDSDELSLAFNYSRKESDLEQYSEKELMDYAEKQKGTKVNVIKANSKSVQAEVMKSNRLNVLSTWFLYLLACCLIAEMIIVRFFD